MKYKYKKLILKLYLYRYLKLNPIKFNLYYQLVSFISKLLLEIGKPFIFLRRIYYNHKHFFIIPYKDRENEEIYDEEEQQIINMQTLVNIHINSRKEKLDYSDCISLIYSFFKSQNLVYCDKKLILNHPTLPDRVKKLMVDIPFFRNIDYIKLDYDRLDPKDKVPTDFYINHYFDFNDPKDKKLILDWAYFEHNDNRTLLFYNDYYFCFVLLEESNQSFFYINIYKKQVHLEIIKFIKFFYTYFKFVSILIVANFFFGFAAAKLLISFFLLYGFFSILKAKRYVLFLKRVWILFLFSIGYSFLNLSISIPLLNLIVSFLILKTIYFIVVNIGSISYKLNYPKYTFINWLYDLYWGKIEIFLQHKRFNYKYSKTHKNEEKALFYQKLLLWLESIEERETTLLRIQK